MAIFPSGHREDGANSVPDCLLVIPESSLDAFMLLTGFNAQKTSQQKSEDAPDNLFEPIAGFDRVEGDFSSKTQPSVSTWLDTHPTAKWGAIASVLVGVSALALLTGAFGTDRAF